MKAFFVSMWTTISEIAMSLSWQNWIALVILTYVGCKTFVFLARYLHRRYEYKKLIHLKVTLPRNDSKLDTEKRTEKDFHEQVGKAEQLFRAIHETRDLNLYNVIFKRILWRKPEISFELQFEKRELIFVVVCDRYYQKIVQKQVTTFYQSAEIEILDRKDWFDLKPKGYHANGYFLHTADKYWFPIQTYKQIEEDPLNNLANSFSKLEKEEKGVIQIIVHPKSKRWKEKAKAEGTKIFKGKKKKLGFSIPIISPILNILFLPIKVLFQGYDPDVDSVGSNAPGANGGGDSYVRMLQPEEEIAKKIGEKSQQSGFETTIRVFASSQRKERVNEILNGIFVSFNVFKAKGANRFENRRIIPIDLINSPIMRHNFKYRLGCFFEKWSLLCSEELATIYHYPDARYNKIPTIKWLAYKILPPPLELPETGIILGNSVYRGEKKAVRMLPEDRSRHQYIIGKSGTGKSALISYMARQDVANGEGVCVIDPHGDLIEDILKNVPKERAKDVIVFDPGDLERPMGLNILEANNEEEKDRASLDAMEIFIKLFGNEIFGPRIQHYFRNGCLTIMSDKDEGATLIDIPRLFIDDDFQKYKVSKVTNPFVRSFWENEMAKTGAREKEEMIPYFTSKFGPFVTNTTMRNIIGQTKSGFNIREAMDNKKVVLINLSKGKIGGINAQLLGLIIVSKINMAAMSRVDTPESERVPFYLYVDEFQNFSTDTFASILSEARKYKLCLIMAHQYIAQLSESAGGVAIGQKDTKIRDAVFGNVGTMMSFKVGAEDAEYLEKEYAPTLSQQDILSIANYKVYLKLNIKNTTSRPFSMETIWDPSGENEKIAGIVKKYSRMKYGRKKEFVDAEIEARMGIDNLSEIAETAKNDETMPNEFLGENPIAETPTELAMKGVTPAVLAEPKENTQPKVVTEPQKVITEPKEVVLNKAAPAPEVIAEPKKETPEEKPAAAEEPKAELQTPETAPVEKK